MGKDNNMESQEIDLVAVGRSVRRRAGNINRFFFRSIRFAARNIVWILAALILGAGLGFMIDRSTTRVYHNQIVVAPNFGSVDYLYSKVALLSAKVKERDTTYLKSIGIADPDAIRDIEINPVVDVFKFVSNGTEQNYRLLELMAQDGDMKKIIVDPTTSKNYPYHNISLTVKGITTRAATIDPILHFLNDSEFYKKVQQQYIQNVELKLKADDVIISQIDGLLSGLVAESGSKSQVYINQNTQLNDIIKTKDELIKEQGNYRLELVSDDRIIKDVTVSTNIKDDSLSNGSMKIILPMVFLMLYLLGYAFVSFYRAQSRKEKALP